MHSLMLEGVDLAIKKHGQNEMVDDTISDGSVPKPVVPGWGHAGSVWWLIVWRVWACGMILTGISWLSMKMLRGAVPALEPALDQPGVAFYTAPAATGLIWVLLSVWVVRSSLRKRYGTFRIGLFPMPPDSSTTRARRWKWPKGWLEGGRE